MSGLKIHVYSADMGGCGRYRLLHAAAILKGQGHDITIHHPDKGMNISVKVDFETDDVIDVIAPEADVLVMQRIASRPHVQAIKILRERGYTVVLDLDDDMTRIPVKNKAYQALDPRNGTRMSWLNTSAAAEAATLVTVSTKALVDVYGHHGRVMILDNWVPERYLELSHQDRPLYGWAGSIESHPDDLPVVGNAARLLAQEGHHFFQVGPHQLEVTKQLELPVHRATGPVSMSLWASSVSLLGISWVPLVDTLFNAAKSRLKGLESNSVGVPYIASPRAEYVRMTAEGAGGLLASKPREWYKKTLQLLTDHSMRRELGQQGREWAATQTIEKHAWKVLEAWHYAYDIQHGKLRDVSTVDLAPRREGKVIRPAKEVTA